MGSGNHKRLVNCCGTTCINRASVPVESVAPLVLLADLPERWEVDVVTSYRRSGDAVETGTVLRAWCPSCGARESRVSVWFGD